MTNETIKKIIDILDVNSRNPHLYDIAEEIYEKFIEPLEKEIEQRRDMMQRMDCNYATELHKTAELQKRVDELKAFKNEAISTSLYGVGRKDGKAVANALWIDITSHYFALRVLGNATVELDKLAEFWHKYGVEVE